MLDDGMCIQISARSLHVIPPSYYWFIVTLSSISCSVPRRHFDEGDLFCYFGLCAKMWRSHHAWLISNMFMSTDGNDRN